MQGLKDNVASNSPKPLLQFHWSTLILDPAGLLCQGRTSGETAEPGLETTNRRSWSNALFLVLV